MKRNTVQTSKSYRNYMLLLLPMMLSGQQHLIWGIHVREDLRSAEN